MKLLISILNLCISIMLTLCAGSAGILALAGGICDRNASTMWEHIGLCTLNGLYFLGLLCAVIVSVAGPVSMLLAFIFKSWIRAVISICMSVAAMALWKFFMEYAL